MQTEIDYILNLSKQYKVYAENSDALFAAVNKLPAETIRAIYAKYGEGKRNFRTTNFLRAELARLVLEGVANTKDLLEETKDKIRSRKTDEFPHQSSDFLKSLKDYPVKSLDMFVNWQKDWSVFYTFFYRGETKKTVKLYLEQIGKKLLTDLNLPNYKAKVFDFQGARNIGETSSWIGLVPQKIDSQKTLINFFLGFRDNFLAGLGVGFNIKNRSKDTEIPVENYEQALEVLQSCREEIISLNEQILQSRESEKAKLENRKYYKFAPGAQASQWEKFRTESTAGLSYKDSLRVGDISEISSLNELNLAADLSADSQSNETWNLWLFKTAKIGDVLFATKGINTCLGIGVIESEYY